MLLKRVGPKVKGAPQENAVDGVHEASNSPTMINSTEMTYVMFFYPLPHFIVPPYEVMSSENHFLHQVNRHLDRQVFVPKALAFYRCILPTH